MGLSHIGKSISTVFSPNGDLYTFWNDYLSLPESTIFKDVDDTVIFTFTKSETRKYRCLLFQKHYTTYSAVNTTVIPTYPVMFNNSSDRSLPELYPLYECLSPQVHFDGSRGGAILTFWSNMQSTFDSSKKLYDRTQVIRYTEDQLSNISTVSGLKRCMFSATIIFKQYKINGDGIMDIYPICALPHLVFEVTGENIPVTDFSTGGGGGGMKIHDHADRDNGNFAYAIYHPGTALPKKPWR